MVLGRTLGRRDLRAVEVDVGEVDRGCISGLENCNSMGGEREL